MVKLEKVNEFAEVTHNGAVIAVIYRNDKNEVIIVPNSAEKVKVNTIQK